MKTGNPYRRQADDSEALYRRALEEEPRLRAIVAMVASQTIYIRKRDEFCYACYWENVLKPLMLRLIGWERPTLPENPWLRSSEAWDAVSHKLLADLWDADPGNGCGFARNVVVIEDKG